MDNGINSPIFWMITTGITTLSSVILGIITWIKSAKLMPKELTKADLENKKVEISLADQYEELATRTAEKAINLQSRLNKLEEDYSLLQTIIKEQSKVIESQSVRLDNQDKKLKEQDGEIGGLVKELNLAKAYNFALIKQMKKENLIPLDISTVSSEEYKEEVNGSEKKRTYTKKQDKDNSENKE